MSASDDATHCGLYCGGLRRADPNATNTIDFPHVNGQLSYLVAHTMPWLLCASNIFSSTSRPSVAIPDAPMPGHRTALARTIRYISGAGHYGLSYTQQSEGFTLTGYCDVSHGREMHQTASGFCMSRSGGCIVASGASTHAFSQAQQPTALSTFESELTALVLLIKNLLALRHPGAHVLDASLPTSMVHCNNMSVIMQLHKRDFSARTRHVSTNLGFVNDAIDDGDIIVQHVHTMKNPTSTFTATENRDRSDTSTTLLLDHAAYIHVFKQETGVYKQAPSHVRVRALRSLRGNTTYPQQAPTIQRNTSQTSNGTQRSPRKEPLGSFPTGFLDIDIVSTS